MKNIKLTNVCPVLVSEDIVKTVNFYVEKLGFEYAKHYDKIDNFATLYRDSIELVVVQSRFGKVESNTKRYGAGYDIYMDPDTIDGRLIGIGLIWDNKVYFENSDFIENKKL